MIKKNLDKLKRKEKRKPPIPRSIIEETKRGRIEKARKKHKGDFQYV